MLLVWLAWPILVLGVVLAVGRMETRLLPRARGTLLVPERTVSPAEGDAAPGADLEADLQRQLSGGR